jgi:hypothetical protein
MGGERLDLRKEVFNKDQYIKTINTRFDELGAKSITQDLIVQPTVEEFFGLYNSLFYDIPAIGETNSHEYLVKTSGEYINFDDISEEITALQAEISQLRQNLLNAQLENIKVQTAQTGDVVSDSILATATQEIEAASQQLIETNTTLSENTRTSTGG